MGCFKQMGTPHGVMARRAVFDTNVVVSALVFRSRLAWLRQTWRAECLPVICAETAGELARVLTYPKFGLTPVEQNLPTDDYLAFAETLTLPEPRPSVPATCRDRKDIVGSRSKAVER